MYKAIYLNYYNQEIINKSINVITSELEDSFNLKIKEIDLNNEALILIQEYKEINNLINYSGLANELEITGNVYLTAKIIERLAIDSYKKDKTVDIELMKTIKDKNLINNILKIVFCNDYNEEINNDSERFISSKIEGAAYTCMMEIELNEQALNLIGIYTKNNLIDYSGLAKELEVSKNAHLAAKVIERLAVNSYKKDRNVDVELIIAIINHNFIRCISNIVSFRNYVNELNYDIELITSKIGYTLYSRLT